MIRVRIAAVLLALAALTQSAGGQLVTNGGFETGNLNGWTVTGTNCATVVFVEPHSGSFSLRSGPVGGTCSVSQSIATTTGAQYTFSFWVQNLSGGTPNSFEARWSSSALYSTTNAPMFGYTQQMFTVTATAPTTIIAFVIQHDPSFYTLDDVSVLAVSIIPEPSTLALMAAGLLGTAATLRRRRA